MEIAFKFYATSRTERREVSPLGGDTFAILWDKESSDERADYSENFGGELVFVGGDFEWLLALEQSEYRCEPIAFEVEQNCGGVFTDLFRGRISLNGGKWNLDKQIVKLGVPEADLYTCFEDGKDIDYNLFNYIAERQTISPVTGTLERTVCGTVGHGAGGNCFPENCPEDLEAGAWALEYQSYEVDEFGACRYEMRYVREVTTIPSAGALAAPWILLSDDGTDKLYARKPSMVNPVYGGANPNYPDNYDVSYRVLGSGTFATIDNGLKLRKVFEVFLAQLCPGLTLKSDFFQWNPDTVTTVNYATALESKVLNLILFQKSDVKRAADLNNASRAELSFEKLVSDICRIFNARWEINTSAEFRIEHVSWYTRPTGFDLTLPRYAAMMNGQRRYSYDNDKLARREVFKWMDNVSGGDFSGLPITYEGACVGPTKSGDKNFSVEKITTDVIHCMSNPASDGSVADEGFVLIACDAGNGIIREASILGGNDLNNSLAWAQLHRDYYRHQRPQRAFTMNGAPELALSVIPIKQQETLDVPLYCGDIFDPAALIKTYLGDAGTVKSAKFHLFKRKLTLELLFAADEGLVYNSDPVGNSDVLSTYENIAKLVDVLANDTDAEGLVPSTLQIIIPPGHGTAVIQPDYSILYTPADGYTGGDFFAYRVQDTSGDWTNGTGVTVTVLAGSPEAEANSELYLLASGRSMVKEAPGLLLNDTGPGAVSATAETKPTSQGGSVTINADGSFTYTPPVGFIGDDTFTYTMTSLGDSDTGNVTITVFEAEPVYVTLEEDVNSNSGLISENCGGGGGGAAFVGSEQYADYTLKFWSDAAKTVPMNVTYYDLMVNIRHIQIDQNSNSFGSFNVVVPVGVAGGISTTFSNGMGNGEAVKGFRTYYEYYGCEPTVSQIVDASLELEPGPLYNL